MAAWDGSPRAPRAWQAEALPRIGQALRDGKKPVVRAATGSGKAQLISELCAQMQRDGEVVVVVAPRQALVEQLSGVEDDGDLRPGSIAWRIGIERVGVYYGRRKIRLDAPVVVTCGPSLGSLALVLAASGRVCRLLIVDEAHRSESASLLESIELLAPRWRVGLSATPWRSDKAEALSLFDCEVYTYGIAQALRDHTLVPWETIGWDVDRHGDPGADVACMELIRRHGEGPGIVSAKSIDDAEAYAATLTAGGIAALAIHSRLLGAERRDRIARLLAGELRCLVHVALLSEGTDIPELRWICMRRPSATAIRFVQELGRVLRTAPGKERALLLDPFDHEGLIGIVHDSRIGEALDRAISSEVACVCDSTEHAHDGTCGATFTPYPGQPEPYRCVACRPTGAAREATMPPLVAVSEVTRWARRMVMMLVAEGLAESPLPGGKWRGGMPSERQLSALRKMGGAIIRAVLPHADKLSRGEVSDLIGLVSAVRDAKRHGRALPTMPEPTDALTSLETR